jgi:hypothetical protein
MNRRDTLFGLLALGSAPLATRAQPAATPARIAFLLFGRRPPGPVPAITNRFLDAFKQGMRELGHVEGYEPQAA